MLKNAQNVFKIIFKKTINNQIIINKIHEFPPLPETTSEAPSFIARQMRRYEAPKSTPTRVFPFSAGKPQAKPVIISAKQRGALTLHRRFFFNVLGGTGW